MTKTAPLQAEAFWYDLPVELIAQKPLAQRDHSRLMQVNRQTQQLSHHQFYDLPNLLQPGDILIRNNTKVLPARVHGRKETGGKIEVLLNKHLESNQQGEVWECLTKPGLKLDQRVTFGHTKDSDSPPLLQAKCIQIDGFKRIIHFNKTGLIFLKTLEEIGQTPIPPYIAWQAEDEPQLRQQYQTTYAKKVGSVAAPTAGLHFTPELDQQLAEKGIKNLELTLHVGLGTFQPVQPENIKTQALHSEIFELAPEIATALTQAKQAGQRLIAVGTTSTRVLVSCFDLKTNTFQPQNGETDLFIYPPREIKTIDGLITNFHQPQSSLMMLVSALVSAPNTPHTFVDLQSSLIGQAYQTAIQEKYRFHSFGDAMLII